ncbi:MAG: glycogen debranching enzyme, partial [Chloroflexota bacterium]
MSTTLRRGRCYPLGATLDEDGVNFSLFSKNATRIELCLFDRVDDYRPARVITLWPHRNRTFYYWHVFVPGLQAGQIYAYRVEGPYNPKAGHRFVGDKLLLDPYGKAVAVPRHYSRI